MNHNRHPSADVVDQVLNELRELFREDFKVNDYCIGQECVEKLFRKLLNEPESSEIRDPSLSQTKSYANASEVFRAELDSFISKTKNIFESEEMLYKAFFEK